VVSGELELVVCLDPRELGIGEARPDVALAGPGQPLGGLLAQALSITAVHGRTVAAGAQVGGSGLRPLACLASPDARQLWLRLMCGTPWVSFGDRDVVARELIA
jgi:hypothetical protein